PGKPESDQERMEGDPEEREEEHRSVDRRLRVQRGERSEWDREQEQEDDPAEEDRRSARQRRPERPVDRAAGPGRAEAAVAHDPPDELAVLDRYRPVGA